MKRYSMACDLKGDQDLVVAWQAWHKQENGWQEVNPKL